MSKYDWSSPTHDNRSLRGASDPSGRRIVTTDAGFSRPTAPQQRQRNAADDQADEGDEEAARLINKYVKPARPKQADADDEIDRRYLAFPEAAEARANTQRETEIRQIFDGEARRNVAVDLIADFTNAVIRAGRTGDPRAFVREKSNREWLTRAMSSTANSGADGGYAIPPGFLDTLSKFVVPAPYSSLYPLCTRLPVTELSGTAPMVVARPEVSYNGEGVDFGDDQPDLDQVTYTVLKRGVKTTIPLELTQDAPGLVEVVRQLILGAMATERERAVAMGTGSNQPTGIYYSSSVDDVSGVTTISYANLVKLRYAVHASYQADPTTVWTFNSMVRKALDGLVDLNGRPLISAATSGIADGTGEMLMGKRIVISDHFPNNFIGYGRVAGMVIFDRGITTLDSSTESGDNFDKYLMTLRAVERQTNKFVRPGSAVMFARSRLLTGIS